MALPRGRLALLAPRRPAPPGWSPLSAPLGAAGLPEVATFTDTYLPTVNGVTYTITAWRERWRDRGGRMDVVYPAAPDHEPEPGERPVPSLPFPFYEGFRYGAPKIPAGARDVDVVHVHSPFPLGVAGLRLAEREGQPLVASYHTPTAEYAAYLAPGPLSGLVADVASFWERTVLDRVDLVLAPSETAAEHVRESVGVAGRVEALPNGVDLDRFEPVDASAFREDHGLDGERPLVGYTGRHGHEKRLETLVAAADGLDATLVFGGDGPARSDLERLADERDVDARFLGFLPRAELPAFYAALDVFAFPSPVETQGIVALEAMACGTPVVAADAAALSGTVDDGVTGVHFEPGDADAFRAAIERALAEREALRAGCLDRRPETSVEHAVDRLAEHYASLLE